MIELFTRKMFTSRSKDLSRETNMAVTMKLPKLHLEFAVSHY